jgi:hypothetical protein
MKISKHCNRKRMERAKQIEQETKRKYRGCVGPRNSVKTKTCEVAPHERGWRS